MNLSIHRRSLLTEFRSGPLGWRAALGQNRNPRSFLPFLRTRPLLAFAAGDSPWGWAALWTGCCGLAPGCVYAPALVCCVLSKFCWCECGAVIFLYVLLMGRKIALMRTLELHYVRFGSVRSCTHLSSGWVWMQLLPKNLNCLWDASGWEE